MSSCIAHMTHAAMMARLTELAAQLRQAALAGDLARASSMDHAIRNVAIAILGSVPPSDESAERQLRTLRQALEAVEFATSKIREQQKNMVALRNRTRRVYLAYDRGQGKG